MCVRVHSCNITISSYLIAQKKVAVQDLSRLDCLAVCTGAQLKKRNMCIYITYKANKKLMKAVQPINTSIQLIETYINPIQSYTTPIKHLYKANEQAYIKHTQVYTKLITNPI